MHPSTPYRSTLRGLVFAIAAFAPLCTPVFADVTGSSPSNYASVKLAPKTAQELQQLQSQYQSGQLNSTQFQQGLMRIQAEMKNAQAHVDAQLPSAASMENFPSISKSFIASTPVTLLPARSTVTLLPSASQVAATARPPVSPVAVPARQVRPASVLSPVASSLTAKRVSVEPSVVEELPTEHDSSCPGCPKPIITILQPKGNSPHLVAVYPTDDSSATSEPVAAPVTSSAASSSMLKVAVAGGAMTLFLFHMFSGGARSSVGPYTPRPVEPFVYQPSVPASATARAGSVSPSAVPGATVDVSGARAILAKL